MSCKGYSDQCCGYNTLGSYYGHASPVAKAVQRQTAGVYVTPNYGAIGYDALTHGGQSCSSYPSVTDAYGSGCTTSYSTRMCGGGSAPAPVGQKAGWSCDAKQGKCVHGAKLGTQGTFGSASQCQAACHRV